MPSYILEAGHLVKKYNEFTAVDDISFAVHEGVVFGQLDPNGGVAARAAACQPG